MEIFVMNFRKSYHLDTECNNSELSFLSETTRNSTPLNGSPAPNLRTNSLRVRKENQPSKSGLGLAEEDTRKSNPELGQSMMGGFKEAQQTAHILTLGRDEIGIPPFLLFDTKLNKDRREVSNIDLTMI